jgi:hypothetical protein
MMQSPAHTSVVTEMPTARTATGEADPLSELRPGKCKHLSILPAEALRTSIPSDRSTDARNE